jgi:hypothetical protein
MTTVTRLCRQSGKPIIQLRTSSLASLLSGRTSGGDHYVRGLDYGVSFLAFCNFKFIDRLIRDRRGDNRAANIEKDMGRGLTFSDLDHGARNDISSAEFHRNLLVTG